MSDHAQDFRDRMERDAAEPPTAWKPEPGDLLLGSILDIDARTTAHSKRPNDCPVITILNEDDEVVYDWWAYHDVAKKELAKLRPKVGERIAVRYMGRHPNGYFMYKIRIDRQDRGTFDWSRVEPDPDGLPPEAAPNGNVLQLQAREPKPVADPLSDDSDLPF
jgi:hypothetical protein